MKKQNIQKIKEQIIKKLEGESEEDIEKEILDSFGFGYVSDIGSRHDGSVIIEVGLEDIGGKECELWVDYVGERTLIYNFGNDLYFLEGGLTKEEEKKWDN